MKKDIGIPFYAGHAVFAGHNALDGVGVARFDFVTLLTSANQNPTTW